MSNGLMSRLEALSKEKFEPSAQAAALKELIYSGESLKECFVKIRAAHGPNAMILSTRTVRKGAWFGMWGGREVFEVRCGIEPNAGRSVLNENRTSSTGRAQSVASHGSQHPESIAMLERKVADLTASIGRLSNDAERKSSTVSDLLAEPAHEGGWGRGRKAARPAAQPIENQFQSLLNQLVNAEVAVPLARQLIGELDPGLSAAEAAVELRTSISRKLKVANRLDLSASKKMEILAFIGTTGVGKTTTITKLAAQYGLIERRKIGIITLDTHRIAAAQQLQTYGQLMQVPVKVAHDQIELAEQLAEYENDGTALVLLDTAGRSPNDMLPLNETATLFHDMGKVHKYLALPATLSVRDMDHVIAKFMNILKPEAIVLTKLDESSDNTCFGKLLTVQAKYGLPLAYVTTGQKVPDDIAFPDPHAIAARLLSTAVL